MKKPIVLLLFFFSIISPSRAEDVPQVKLKEGFRDLSFGAKLSDVDGLIKVSQFQDYVTYERPNDVLMLGKIPLDSIRYDFWNGKLALVVLKKKTTLMSMSEMDLLDFLTSIYGKPTQRTHAQSNVSHTISGTSCDTWEDDKTCIIYTFKMSYSSGTLGEKDMTIAIRSKEMDSERMRAQGEINSKSPNGL